MSIICSHIIRKLVIPADDLVEIARNGLKIAEQRLEVAEREITAAQSEQVDHTLSTALRYHQTFTQSFKNLLQISLMAARTQSGEVTVSYAELDELLTFIQEGEDDLAAQREAI